MLVHAFLINEQVGAFEERNKDAEDRVAPLLLLVRQVLRRARAAKQVEVGVIEHELQEFTIFVRKALENFLFLALPFLALLEDKHEDRKRERKGVHDVEHHFAILEQ